MLVDGLTRLGRAYNVAGPTSGRTLAGGVDASALTATKRFFGAARNLEDGGSLTILATALVDSGSTVDELLVEELTGTESLVLRLDGDLAERAGLPGGRPRSGPAPGTRPSSSATRSTPSSRSCAAG